MKGQSNVTIGHYILGKLSIRLLVNASTFNLSIRALRLIEIWSVFCLQLP